MDNLVIKLQAQNRLTIGIIGAAVAGPVFALQILSHPILSKLYKPIVYDAAPCPGQSENPTSETLQTAGAAVAISPNGLFPLYELGLRYAVEENSCEPPKLRIWRSGYGDPGSGDIKDANAKNFHLLYSGAKNAYWNKDIRTGMRTMERRHLQSLLLARLRELGGEINWGMRLTHIKELDNNKIDITFQSGQSRRVDLLVGADGGWSTVRKHVIKARFGDDPAATNRWMPGFMGATGFYGVTRKLDVNKRVDADAPADTHGIWLDRGNLSSSPLPNGGVRWDLILPGDLPPIRSATIDNIEPKTGWESKIIPGAYDIASSTKILREHAGIYHPVSGTFGHLLLNSERIIRTPLRQHVWEANEIHHGNVVVIGDAARLMLPSSGQGTAFAIEDATVLANCLLNKPPTNDKPDLHNAFSHYAQLRVPRSKLMAKTAYWIGVAGLGQTWYWRWLRDFSSKWTAAGEDLKLNNKDVKQWPFDARLKVEIDEKAI